MRTHRYDFYGNPQLFKLHYQPLEPIKTNCINKKCYSCGIKGHIKRDCQVQGLKEEEEIEWVFQKPSIKEEEEVIKEVFRQLEVPFEEIPDEVPYDFNPYED